MTVCPESFFKTLKREEVYLHDYRTFEGPLPPTLGPVPLRRSDHALGDLRQVQRAAVIKAALAFGQRQERFQSSRCPYCSLRSSSRPMVDRMDEVSECQCTRLSSSNACSRVSGVRSSCAALATKRFCASKALSRHSSSPSTASARFRRSSDRFGRGQRALLPAA